MDTIIKTLINIFITILIALPPFLYLYWYMQEKVNSIVIRVIIYIVYWGSIFFLSNLPPALAVLMVIRGARVGNKFPEDDCDTRFYGRLSLIFSSDRWRFSTGSFIRISLLGILIKVAVTYANIIFIIILNFFHIPLESQEIINEFIKSGVVMSIFYFILIVFCAPVVEEFVFRFWIYDRILKRRIGTMLSVLLSSMLFMILHFNIQGAISFFLIGVINCILYEKKGYWAAVANHFMFNLITAVILVAAKLLNI